MISSLHRIITIGRNTLTEAVRQKVLNVLLIFSLVLVGSSVVVSQLATPGLDSAGIFDAQIKFVKDFGCGAIGLFGFFIALLSTAQLIPQELHNRTIYTILAKPVRRVGISARQIFRGRPASGALRGADVAGLRGDALLAGNAGHSRRRKRFTIRRRTGGPIPLAVNAYNHDIAQIVQQVRDPQLIEAVLLIFAKLVMTTGIALLISTFATSSIFTIVTTFMIYLIGHMESTAREFWLARRGRGLHLAERPGRADFPAHSGHEFLHHRR